MTTHETTIGSTPQAVEELRRHLRILDKIAARTAHLCYEIREHLELIPQDATNDGADNA